MDEIKVIAASLLLMRFISVFFLVLVVRRQIQLMRSKNNPEVQGLRKTLFALASVMLVMQIVPILIDVVTLFGNPLNRNPATIGVLYAYSNAITSIIASILLWLIYRISETKNAGLTQRGPNDLKK